MPGIGCKSFESHGFGKPESGWKAAGNRLADSSRLVKRLGATRGPLGRPCLGASVLLGPPIDATVARSFPRPGSLKAGTMIAATFSSATPSTPICTTPGMAFCRSSGVVRSAGASPLLRASTRKPLPASALTVSAIDSVALAFELGLMSRMILSSASAGPAIRAAAAASGRRRDAGMWLVSLRGVRLRRCGTTGRPA